MTSAFKQIPNQTIVLLPSGDVGSQIRNLAAEWTSVGLLSPSIWVSSEDVQNSDFERLSLKASVLRRDEFGRTKVNEVSDLIAFLSSRTGEIDTLTLLTAHCVANSVPFDENQDRLADVLWRKLEANLPTSSANQEFGRKSLVRLNLIITPSGVSSFDARRVLGGARYDLQLQASAEDRATPFSFANDIRAEKDSFVPFVLQQIAAAGGLFSGLSKTAFDLIDSRQEGANEVYLTRSYVAGVVHEGTSARAAYRVLDRIANESQSDTDGQLHLASEGFAFYGRQERPRINNDLVDKAFEAESGKLKFFKMEPYEPPKQQRQKLLVRLGDFAKWSRLKLEGLPGFIKQDISEKVTDLANALLDGSKDGLYTGEAPVTSDVNDRRLLKKSEEIRASLREVSEATAQVAPSNFATSTTLLWRSIRRDLFGILDGSDESTDAKTALVFKSVSELFSDPSKPLIVSDPDGNGLERVDWDDSKQAGELLERIRRKHAEKSNEFSALESQIHEVSQNLEVRELELKPVQENISHREEERRREVEERLGQEFVNLFPGASSPTSLDSSNSDDGLKSTGQDEIGAESGTAAVDSESQDQKTLTELRRFASSLKKEIKSLREELSTLTAKSVIAKVEIEKLGDDLAITETYAERANDSFVGRMLLKMNDQNASALKAHQDYLKLLEDIRIPPSGQLQAMKRTFYSKVLSLIGSVLGALVTIFLIANISLIASIPVFGPPTALGVIVALLLIFGAAIRRNAKSQREISDHQESASELAVSLSSLRKKPTATLFSMFRTLIFLLGVTTVLIFMPPPIQAVISSIVHAYMIWIFSAWLLFSLLGLIDPLLTYRRNWSIWAAAVKRAESKLDYVKTNEGKSQQEIQRLESLYGQLKDWVRIIALALYRPWKTDPEWLEDKSHDIRANDFPNGLRLAKSRESDSESIANLEKKLEASVKVVGWRKGAFENMVAEIAANQGFTPSEFNLERLDEDLPHESNGTRAILRAFLVAAAESNLHPSEVGVTQSVASGTKAVNDQFAYSVARAKLIELEDIAARQVSQSLKPKVEPVVNRQVAHDADPLTGQTISETSLDWDEFLTLSLGKGSVESVPVSVSNFNERGIFSKDDFKFKTEIQIPSRIEASLPRLGQSVNVTTYFSDESSEAIEMVSRLDVSGPVSVDYLRAFEEPNRES